MHIALVLAAGCSFTPGQLAGSGDGGDIGGDIGDAAACSLWQPRHFTPCSIPMASDEPQLSTVGSPYTYDTSVAGGELRDTASQLIPITSIEHVQAGNVSAALWTMGNLMIASGVELRVIGSKPLIIAAWQSIAVAGRIDVGSHAAVRRVGAGSNPASCATHAAGAGASGDSGNGGGGGGGFAGSGGPGGNGDANCTPVQPACERAGGLGGTSVAAPTIVIGGCNGGESGAAFGTRAAGGRGGGGIVLAARDSVQITGAVLAGGGGGFGDPNSSVSTGGGGGGAGGFIGLDGVSIDVSGTLAANGAGGGAGADFGNTGGDGFDGAATTMRASGGNTGGGGTNGGFGSSQAALDGIATTGTTQNGGGGGGGGGAGFILYWSPSFVVTGGTVSPPAAPGP